MPHVGERRLSLQFTVYARLDRLLVRVAQLVFGDDDGTEHGGQVEHLADAELGRVTPVPLYEVVVVDRKTEDVLQRMFDGDVSAALANNNDQLALAFE